MDNLTLVKSTLFSIYMTANSGIKCQSMRRKSIFSSAALSVARAPIRVAS